MSGTSTSLISAPVEVLTVNLTRALDIVNQPDLLCYTPPCRLVLPNPDDSIANQLLAGGALLQLGAFCSWQHAATC